jgi:excisionase family DNA binding protein
VISLLEKGAIQQLNTTKVIMIFWTKIFFGTANAKPRSGSNERGKKKGMGTIMTPKEVGRFLKISESTVYKLIKEKDLPGFKIGDSWRFDLDEINQLIEKAKEECNQKIRY